jgi:hypothetical protein
MRAWWVALPAEPRKFSLSLIISSLAHEWPAITSESEWPTLFWPVAPFLSGFAVFSENPIFSRFFTGNPLAKGGKAITMPLLAEIAIFV